ncbi:MAG: AAA family ATPase [Alphaproteobacteria bacterium]|nr:AAA family ATPase [Alphaproteobacteria bacterium]
MGILSSKAHIIVIANEKGGTGKSTLSMHLAIKLLYENFKVAVIDLDGRQGSLSKYIENRRIFCSKNNIYIPSPVHYIFEPVAKEANKKEIEDLITDLSSRFDAIIIDTPGGRNYLFELAHKFLHTLITPISDSLVDLSAIADINPDNGEIIKAGHYAEFVWETKKKLASKELPYLNWIVCGNKISALRSKNKELIFSKLSSLAKLYGFRFTEGLKDRVIYKELFLDGLTILDMNSPKLHRRLNVSHLAAKMELNSLVEFIFP